MTDNEQPDKPEYELALCNNCNQMTNHLDEKCMKCGDAPMMTEPDKTLREQLRELEAQSRHGDGYYIIPENLRVHIDVAVDRLISLVDNSIAQAVIKELKSMPNYEWNSMEDQFLRDRINELETKQKKQS